MRLLEADVWCITEGTGAMGCIGVSVILVDQIGGFETHARAAALEASHSLMVCTPTCASNATSMVMTLACFKPTQTLSPSLFEHSEQPTHTYILQDTTPTPHDQGTPTQLPNIPSRTQQQTHHTRLHRQTPAYPSHKGLACLPANGPPSEPERERVPALRVEAALLEGVPASHLLVQVVTPVVRRPLLFIRQHLQDKTAIQTVQYGGPPTYICMGRYGAEDTPREDTHMLQLRSGQECLGCETLEPENRPDSSWACQHTPRKPQRCP